MIAAIRNSYAKLRALGAATLLTLTLVLTACGGGGGGGGGGAAPALTTQPQNQTVTAGDTASFSVVASGSAPLTYQWQVSTKGADWNDVTEGSGGKTASYTTPTTTSTMSGHQYRVTVTNSAGSTNSSAATLTVNSSPILTTQPQSQTVTAPATATFSVVASGSATFTYQWQVSTNGVDWNDVTDGSGGATASYTTPATTSGMNSWRYRVTVTNPLGTITSPAVTLTVNTASLITTQPQNQSAIVDATASFSVVAASSGALTYQWQVSTDSGSTWINVSTGTGGATASYTTPPALLTMNAYQYRVRVTDSLGGAQTSNAATLTVTDPVVSASAITTHPASQNVESVGGPFCFTVQASGGGLNYQWGSSLDGGATWSDIDGATQKSYCNTLPATTTMQGYLYRVKVSNTLGTVTSNSAKLTAYALVPKTGGNYLKTECVKDNITGLYWEGKTAGAYNDVSNRHALRGYTNFDPDHRCMYTGECESDDVVNDGYYNSYGFGLMANSDGLCGFNNWRVPSQAELLTIADPTLPGSPKINTTWFPNTDGSSYWTSTPGDSWGTISAKIVDFASGTGLGNSGGFEMAFGRSHTYYVRLVRSAP